MVLADQRCVRLNLLEEKTQKQFRGPQMPQGQTPPGDVKTRQHEALADTGLYWASFLGGALGKSLTPHRDKQRCQQARRVLRVQMPPSDCVSLSLCSSLGLRFPICTISHWPG